MRADNLDDRLNRLWRELLEPAYHSVKLGNALDIDEGIKRAAIHAAQLLDNLVQGVGPTNLQQKVHILPRQTDRLLLDLRQLLSAADLECQRELVAVEARDGFLEFL